MENNNTNNTRLNIKTICCAVMAVIVVVFGILVFRISYYKTLYNNVTDKNVDLSNKNANLKSEIANLEKQIDGNNTDNAVIEDALSDTAVKDDISEDIDASDDKDKDTRERKYIPENEEAKFAFVELLSSNPISYDIAENYTRKISEEYIKEASYTYYEMGKDRIPVLLLHNPAEGYFEILTYKDGKIEYIYGMDSIERVYPDSGFIVGCDLGGGSGEKSTLYCEITKDGIVYAGETYVMDNPEQRKEYEDCFGKPFEDEYYITINDEAEKLSEDEFTAAINELTGYSGESVNWKEICTSEAFFRRYSEGKDDTIGVNGVGCGRLKGYHEKYDKNSSMECDYNYDSDGKLLSIMYNYHYSNGKDSLKEMHYEYDKDGHITESHYIEDGKETFASQYEYDKESGRPENIKSPECEERIIYNYSGDVIDLTLINVNSIEHEIFSYYRDGVCSGRRGLYECYDKNTSVEYDEESNEAIVTVKEIEMDAETETKYIVKFDAYGNPVNVIGYNQNGDIISEGEYEWDVRYNDPNAGILSQAQGIILQ